MNLREYWWRSILILLLGLWAIAVIGYRLGASGIKIETPGAEGTFDVRAHDFGLLAIDDHVALKVDREGDLELVKYARGVFPFCPLCGGYQPADWLVTGARFRHGDWIYTDCPSEYSPALYNLRTGESVKVAGVSGKVDPAANTAYRERGLSFSDSERITPATIRAAGWRSLSPITEDCEIFNAAFLLLVGVWLVVGVIVLAVAKLRPA